MKGGLPPPAAGSRLPPAGGVATKRYFLEGKLDYSGKIGLPSGKLSRNYGKSPLLMGKSSTINGHFQ